MARPKQLLVNLKGNHLGQKKVLIEKQNRKFSPESTKESEKELIIANLKNTTIDREPRASDGVYAIMGLKTQEKNYYRHSSNFPKISALHDLIAPSFYDVSNFDTQEQKPTAKPVGKLKMADRTIYRFKINDFVRKRFTHSGMKLNGVVMVGEETGIKNQLNDNTLTIEIEGEHTPTFREKLKKPLMFFMPKKESLNDRLIEALEKTDGIEKKVFPKKSGEQVFQFKITEEALEDMPKEDKLKLLYKLTTSRPAKKKIKKEFAPILLYAHAEDIQPASRTLKIFELIYSIPIALTAVVRAITKDKEEVEEKIQNRNKIFRPIKVLTEILNIKNTPRVLSALGTTGKIIYLATKPLSMIPVVGEKFDAFMIKKLCKKEIEKREEWNKKETKETKSLQKKKEVQLSNSLDKDTKQVKEDVVKIARKIRLLTPEEQKMLEKKQPQVILPKTKKQNNQIMGK